MGWLAQSSDRTTQVGGRISKYPLDGPREALQELQRLLEPEQLTYCIGNGGDVLVEYPLNHVAVISHPSALFWPYSVYEFNESLDIVVQYVIADIDDLVLCYRDLKLREQGE